MIGGDALRHRACARIATLTLNPTIDTSMEAGQVVDTQKVRTFGERIDPGGGGINVARVLARFGAPVHAVFLAGGSTGRLLDRLLHREGVERTLVPIAGETRVSVTIYEQSTGREFRFVPQGPVVSGIEWRRCLDQLPGAPCEYFVISGSLPRGMPSDFYARVIDQLAPRSIRVVLDAADEEMRLALEGRRVFLLKTTASELEDLVGRPLSTRDQLIEAAAGIVARGAAEQVAVTLGADGAALIMASASEFIGAFEVEARSAVGAGDSFLAAMTYAFACGADPSSALRLAAAAGAAATLSPGTDLCHPWDVTRLAMRDAATQTIHAGH